MSLSSTPRSGRIIRRYVRPQCDAIWIPDSMLKSTFVRYCAISRISVRHGSSVPGPMENRRRSGTRRMGELTFGQAQSGAPFWEIGNAVDLTEWTWRPPTRKDSPVQDSQACARQEATLSGIVSAWLSSPNQNNNPQLQQEEAQIARDALSEGLGRRTPLSALAQDAPTIAWDAQSDPEGIVNQGLDLLLQDVSVSSALSTTPNFTRFCIALRQSLSDDQFPAKAIRVVLRGVREGLARALGSLDENQQERIVDDLKLQLFNAILDGLCVRASNGHYPFEHRLYNDMLHAISELQRNNIRTFARAISCIPVSNLNDVSSGILANLKAYFTAMGRGTRKEATLIRQANKLAVVLQSLDSARNACILAAATKQVSRYIGSQTVNYERARLSWLHLLARMPGVRQSYFDRTCAALEADRNSIPFTMKQICRLFLARLHRHEETEPNHHHHFAKLGPAFIYNSLLRSDEYECYALLAYRLWLTGGVDRIKGLCRFLDKLGRRQDVFRLVLGFNNLVKNDASPLVALALGMGHPRLALSISAHYAESRKRPRTSFWRSDFVERAVKELLQTRSMRPRKLFGALGVFRKQQKKISRIARGNSPLAPRRHILVAPAGNSSAFSIAPSKTI
ncbi:hypothetical protein DL767_009646 [Monosporascus sp. MG133]|nr:hypothetical protein DL767_009646 [Monosporascus sp. MG133]